MKGGYECHRSNGLTPSNKKKRACKEVGITSSQCIKISNQSNDQSKPDQTIPIAKAKGEKKKKRGKKEGERVLAR